MVIPFSGGVFIILQPKVHKLNEDLWFFFVNKFRLLKWFVFSVKEKFIQFFLSFA